MKLRDRIEPSLGPDEGSYRLHYFATDKAQTRASIYVILALFGLAFFAELLAPIEPGPQRQIIVVRVLFLAFSFAMFGLSRAMESPERLDRATTGWTLAFAVQFVVLTAIRPPSRFDDIAAMAMILALYTLAPNPLPWRALAPVILSAGVVPALTLKRDEPPVGALISSIMMLATNALGLMVSARLHTQRRRQYRSEETLRESLRERDALIERLRLSSRMESMGRIVGGVAHDFNNILGTMLGTTAFLIEDLPAGSTMRADAETLQASVKRGAELTKQLLAFSRQQVLESKVVSLNDVVTDTKRMLLRTIGENVEIKVALGEHLAAVKVDPGQVQQMILNLSVNARDAMPHGGTLAIRTRNETLTAPTAMAHSMASPGPYVVLTVADSGSGMDDKTLSQAFEPFFTTKPKGQGTGLGLSTVFGIVEQSGGHIRVESAPGRGTTFDIYLPAVAEPAQPVRTSPAPVAPRGTETILLVEDDSELRALTARVLSAHGYRVLQAVDGVDALRVVDRHQGTLDLLATDMVMPNMGGHALARKLTSQRRDLKVLYMSGYADDVVERDALGEGDAFLQKPVDSTTLVRKVRQVLDGATAA